MMNNEDHKLSFGEWLEYTKTSDEKKLELYSAYIMDMKNDTFTRIAEYKDSEWMYETTVGSLPKGVGVK